MISIGSISSVSLFCNCMIFLFANQVAAFFLIGELGSETCRRCVDQNKVWCDGFCEEICHEDDVISTAGACPHRERNASEVGAGQLVNTEYGLGVVHRHYIHLHEFTVLNSSMVEFKTTIDDQVSIVRDVRYGDLVMAHFRVKSTKEKSRRPAEARVINTTTHNVGVQFTADSVVSTVPWEFIDERIIEL
eukprot:GEMP01065730.1.p1 GENE.GEMP01065730.1~~GEMP01065730.1.p1  ORF type:complete len:200 (+),score=32.11 GEMP01065730.1:32-601(+)